MRRIILAIFMLLALSAAAEAEVTTQVIDYSHDGVALEGFLAQDPTISSLRPGILVVHQWMGITDHERDVCQRLANEGYVAFACDVYGKGIRPADSTQAGEQAGKYRSDRALLRSRVAAGLMRLREVPGVDPDRIAAIGFCFGGGSVLELARGGADVDGVVSFHGNLDTPNPADAQNIRGSVLVCHGADDPFVKPETVTAFEQEMREAGVDWQLISYGNSVHAFTQPGAGNDNSKGAAYNEKAAMRSWQAMLDFFGEIFNR